MTKYDPITYMSLLAHTHTDKQTNRVPGFQIVVQPNKQKIKTKKCTYIPETDKT